MAIEYGFIGWCKEGSSDKVWGTIKLRDGENYWDDKSWVTFWGRRGRKLQTKIVKTDNWGMSKLSEAKERKGYVAIEQGKLNEVYPEFEDDLKKTAFWNMLKV
jgi:hypothetical protein